MRTLRKQQKRREEKEIQKIDLTLLCGMAGAEELAQCGYVPLALVWEHN